MTFGYLWRNLECSHASCRNVIELDGLVIIPPEADVKGLQ